MVDGRPLLVAPPRWTVNELTQLLREPAGRVKTTAKFQDLTSWLEYVERYQEVGTAIWLREESGKLTLNAILDYHEAENRAPPTPRWCQHVACFEAEPRPAWSAWLKADGLFVKQSDFADFLYQNRAEVVEPAGAELLEIVQTLKATAAGEFREARDDFSGSAELIYRMKVSANAGTQDRPLIVPTRFDVAVQPYHGCPVLNLAADLRLRPPKNDGEPLLLGFRFYRLADALEQFTEQLARFVHDRLLLSVWR
jgi:uncharacterized protein YfdQ (DUF2303 family)